MTQLFNQKDKTKLRQKLRRELSRPELVLWYHLRNRQIAGFKFRRQVSIGNIVVDFYCPELKLVIEADGNSHYENADQRLKDKKRDDGLRALVLSVLRFMNLDIMENIEGVLFKIKEFINQIKPPLTPPS
jgi:very-short-patch-repair endonuclease